MSHHRRKYGKSTEWMDGLKNIHLKETEVGSHFFKGCAGKVKFPSKKAALGVKRVMLANTKTYADWEDVDSLSVYRCKFCKAIHLGHPPGSGWKKLQNELRAEA